MITNIVEHENIFLKIQLPINFTQTSDPQTQPFLHPTSITPFPSEDDEYAGPSTYDHPEHQLISPRVSVNSTVRTGNDLNPPPSTPEDTTKDETAEQEEDLSLADGLDNPSPDRRCVSFGSPTDGRVISRYVGGL